MQGILLAPPEWRSCGKAIGWSGAYLPTRPRANARAATAANASAPARPINTHFGLAMAHLIYVQFDVIKHLIVGAKRRHFRNARREHIGGPARAQGYTRAVT